MELPSILMMLTLVTLIARAQTASTPSTLPHPATPALKSIEDSARAGAGRRYKAPPKLTKAERLRIRDMRAPHPEDRERFAAFLAGPGTGLVRLLPDDDCIQNLVVRIDGACANHVEGGSGFNLRARATTGPDLRIERNDLVADGFFALSGLVEMGDIDIETVSLDSNGVALLASIEPATTLKQARTQVQEVMRGRNMNGLLYSNRIGYALNTTYALRVVAFDAGNTGYKLLGRDRYGAGDQKLREKFAAVRDDNRSDVIAVFRVTRIDEDGSVTLIWRKLREIRSPKLRFEDNEKLSDLK